MIGLSSSCCKPQLLAKDLALHLARRKVPVVVETALTDGVCVGDERGQAHALFGPRRVASWG